MSTSKVVCTIALSLLIGATSVRRAEAVPVVFTGIPGNWGGSDSFSVEVIVTGLDSVGASRLSVPAQWGNGLHFNVGSSGNQVDLNWRSFELHGTLTTSPGPFHSGPLVSTVNFESTALGRDLFALDVVSLSVNDGAALLPTCLRTEPCSVPEPGTLALFGAALSALGVRRFRRT